MGIRKKSFSPVSVILFTSLMATCYLAFAFAIDPLPQRFKIYVDEIGTVATAPAEGYSAKILPVINLFNRAPGCYLTCHSTNEERGIYAVSKNSHVVGLIRVEGEYDGPYCRPRDFERSDIKDERLFESLCSRAYRCVGNSCWAGSYTGMVFDLK
jgi:hypothetical protein